MESSKRQQVTDQYSSGVTSSEYSEVHHLRKLLKEHGVTVRDCFILPTMKLMPFETPGPRKPKPRFGWWGQSETTDISPVQSTIALPKGYIDAGVVPGDTVKISTAFMALVLDPDEDANSRWYNRSLYLEVSKILTSTVASYAVGYRSWWNPGSVTEIIPKQ